MSKTCNKMNLPSLYPCGSKVMVPQMGSERGVKVPKPKAPPPFLDTLGAKTGPVSKGYIKKISTDIMFSEDVVRDRCFHMLPYDEKYFYQALDLGNLISAPRKSQIPMSRHNTRKPLSRHMPCHLTKTPLKTPLKPITPQQRLKGTESEEGRSTKLSSEDEGSVVSPAFITEGELTEEGQAKATARPQGIPKHEWDAYLMSKLSSTTANWIVHKRMSPCEHQATLNALLLDWYGYPEHTDLIREDISEKEYDANTKPDKVQKKCWKKSEANLLDRVYGDHKQDVVSTTKGSSTDQLAAPARRRPSVGQGGGVLDMASPAAPQALDPYSEDNKAPFYRQPAGLRRQKKHQDKEAAVGVNSTAREIEVDSYQPAAPLTLRDVVNPQVQDTLYHTDNLFQQEWLTGVQQVFNTSRKTSKIVMSSNNTYEKRLQLSFPRSPESWCPAKPEEKARKRLRPQPVPRVEKGIQKWRALPEPIDDTADILTIISPDYDPDLRGSPDPIARRNTKQNSSMLKILDEWRTQWHLAGQYADSNPDDLIHDMADIQPHVRLKAVATITKAVSYKPPVEPGIQLRTDRTKQDPLEELPEKIYTALEYLLNDRHDQVKRAAAIALYSLNKPNAQAEVIIREAIKGENSADRWAAAQCLAHFGVCDPVVVGEIIQQLLATEDSIKHERAISLLGKVSTDSMLVHSMVAEHLNSSSWRHKVIACKVFPTLQANINKDISQKLADLMWNDWHKEVRSAAAQALGKTGHGKIVHDHLREKILHGPERTRVEAIARVGQLGIMTARLLPSFLQCFDDPYVSVRSEACVTAGHIQIQEAAVIAKLIYRATYDTTWKVKALAVQTLGRIGLASAEVKACLLWALRYEEREGVRAEACHSLILLGEEAVDSDDVIDALQERLLVETSDLVRQQITDALKMVGVDSADDVDMVADIKDAVRKLCTCSNIAAQIAHYESEETKAENKTRMIQQPKEQPQETPKEEESHPDSRPGSRKEDIMKRMKHRASTPIAAPRPSSQDHRSSKTSTPDYCREHTLGTPTVDRELQEVLMKEDRGVSSPDTDMGSQSSPLSKTRTTQASSPLSTLNTSHSPQLSGDARANLTGTVEEEQGEAAETKEAEPLDNDISLRADQSSGTQQLPLSVYKEGRDASVQETQDNHVQESKDDDGGKVGVSFKSDVESNRDGLKGVPQVLVVQSSPSDRQAKTQFKLASCRPKTPGEVSDGVPSRSSSRRRLVSREIQQERDRVHVGAVKSYNDLDARYSGLVGHLDNVDNAYQDPALLQVVASESTGFEVSNTPASDNGELLLNRSFADLE